MQFDTSVWQKAINTQKEIREKQRTAVLLRTVLLLKQYFADKEVTAVYLCGSLLYSDAFDDQSDIDIAVAGLKENYLRVSAELETLLDREIDLIELEQCRFREEIEQEGMRIL
jgi:predicted nucleotidyltransferase